MSSGPAALSAARWTPRGWEVPPDAPHGPRGRGTASPAWSPFSTRLQAALRPRCEPRGHREATGDSQLPAAVTYFWNLCGRGSDGAFVSRGQPLLSDNEIGEHRAPSQQLLERKPSLGPKASFISLNPIRWCSESMNSPRIIPYHLLLAKCAISCLNPPQSCCRVLWFSELARLQPGICRLGNWPLTHYKPRRASWTGGWRL